MKKLLALVLALVMTLSLATVSSNAAFKDADKIDETYAEATEVLSNLGVFKGYTDGSFNPKGDITRAEVAAIVYRIYTGDVTDAQVKNYETYNKFADMAGAGWAKGYIGYCSNAAFIKGYPDGNFKPSGKVTGYEALAMILRAVGYDKNNEFTGADWALHVAQIAQQKGILDNVKGVDLNAAASRELVAELLFQSINVPMVTYTAAFGYQEVGLSTATNKVFAQNETLGSKSFGLEVVAGEIRAVSYLDKTTTFYAAGKVPADDVTTTVLDVDAGFGNIGYAGYVWTVPGAKTNTVTAVSSTYITGESLGSSTDNTPYGTLTNAKSTSYIADKGARVYYNGKLCDQSKDTATSMKDLDTVLGYIGNIGVKADFVDNNNDGKTDVVVITDYTVAQVLGIAKDTTTGYQAVKENTYYLGTPDSFNTSSTAVKASALVCDDELAVADLVTYVAYNGAYYVVKAPVTTDTFVQINYAKVGGTATTYVIGEITYMISAKDSTSADLLARTNLNKKFDVYTDPYGHIIYAQLSKADINYLYVDTNDHTTMTTGMTDTKVYFSDGTEKVIGVASVDGVKKFNIDAIPSHIYSYTENTNGSYTLKLAHSGDQTANYVTKSASWDKLGVNLNTKVIDLRKPTDIKIYTGYNEIPSLTNAEICYIADKNGYITLAYLTSGINTEDLTADLIVFTTDANYERYEDNEAYYFLDVISDNELVKNYKLTETQYNHIKALGVGEYEYDEGGNLDTYTAFNEKWVKAIWYGGALNTYDTETNALINRYTYSDAKFTVLNITAGAVADFSLLTEGGNYQAYLVKNEKTGVVSHIYIIVGDLATTNEYVTGTNPEYIYAVDNDNNKITKAVKADKVVDTFAFLRSATINGKFAVDVTKGTGDGKTAGTAYQLYAIDCLDTINNGIDASAKQTLQVVAKDQDMTINVYVDDKGATVVDTSTDAINYVDAKWTQTNANWFIFSITDKDGNTGWFRVDLKGLSNDSTVSGKEETRVKVNGTTIKVASNVADEQDSAADVLATLAVELNIPKGAELSYTNKTLTVTPECGDAAHVTTYTVEFVTSIQ